MKEHIDENPEGLPDVLEPRRFDAHHGRPESYWIARNELVDAVKACLLPRESRRWISSDERTHEEQEQWDAYGEALDKLKAFDAANGGSPIL